MMDLREPKKKKRVRLQAQPSLPICTDENGEWKIYTAHLGALGTCIVDPVEMDAIYSMGFFGKGSLSRSFPSFGRKRFGAPPIVRDRQWTRRQQWLEELLKLNADSNPDGLGMDMENGIEEHSSLELVEEDSRGKVIQAENVETSDALEKTGETQNNERSEKACKTAGFSGEKDAKKTEEKLDKAVKTNVDPNCTIEMMENEKSSNVDSKQPEKSKDATEPTANEVFCIEPAEDQKPRQLNAEKPEKVLSPVVVDLEANSSLEFIETENCVKKARMDHSGKENHEDPKNKSSSTCDDSSNVEEVLLDSTEDEEICEIVEKEQNDKESSDVENVQVDGDESSANKSLEETGEGIQPEGETASYEVLVIPDTDSDTENYLSNVKPRIERDGFPVNETLHLTFEETFFLMYGLGCLQLLHYDGSIFSINNTWKYFQQQDKYFIQKYIVYHYFRSKGWIVKPGMKYGGDFLLYKQGPPFYHASYIVVIEVMDADTLIRDDMKSLRKMTWKNLIGLERLSETIAKEILFAQILWPSTIIRNGNSMPIEALSEFSVRELLWRRWNPKRKQDIASVDEEDSDSM